MEMSETCPANQIKETFGRYKDANYKLMQQKPMEPAMKYIQSIMDGATKNGQKVGAEDVVQFLQAAAQAYIKNPQMGQQKDLTPDRQGVPVTNQQNLESEFEDQIRRWEEEKRSITATYDARGLQNHQGVATRQR